MYPMRASEKAGENRVLKVAEAIQSYAFGEEYTSYDRTHYSKSNVCYLEFTRESSRGKETERIKISGEDSESLEGCSAVVTVGEGAIDVSRNDGKWKVFRAKDTPGWVSFVFKQ